MRPNWQTIRFYKSLAASAALLSRQFSLSTNEYLRDQINDWFCQFFYRKQLLSLHLRKTLAN